MATTSFNATQITPPRVPIVDERTGLVSREWYRYFYSLYAFTGGGTGILPIPSGGTGLDTIPTNGQLLIGDTASSAYKLHVIDTGSGIGITNGAGTILITNTGVLSNIAGSGIGVSSATGNVTVSNTGVLSAIAGSGVSVSSATGNITFANTGVLSFSGGSTGLLPSSATTGAVSLSGTLGVGYGGTGKTSFTANGVLYASSTSALDTGSTLTFDGSNLSVSGNTKSATFAASGQQLLSASGTISATTYLVTMYSLVGTATLTLPSSPIVGQIIRVRTQSAQAVISASNNITTLASGAVTNAILSATAGKWADLWWDGTYWNITAAN